MNFFLLYVSLPALLFVIMSKTPFAELNNPPFLIATTLGTMIAFVLAMLVGRVMGRLGLREMTLAGLSGAYGNIGYMGPGLATAVLMASLPPALNVFVIARQNDTWVEPASVAVLIGTFTSVLTLTSAMWLLQTGRLAFS